MASITRLITGADVDAARNLKAIYVRKKRELNLSQVKLEKLMGMRQATISQYMNGVIALNTDAVLAFSKALRVHPGEIDPRLGRLLNSVMGYAGNQKDIPVLGYTSGAPSPGEVETIKGSYGDHAFAVIVDVNVYAPTLEKGVAAILDPMMLIKKGGMVGYRRKNRERYEFAHIHNIDEDAGKFTFSNINDRKGEEKFEVAMDDVGVLYAVAGYQQI